VVRPARVTEIFPSPWRMACWSTTHMESFPILAALLFPAASGSATAIDVAGNVWLTGQTNSIQTTANAFQKTAVSTVCAMEDPSPFQRWDGIRCGPARSGKWTSVST
jgi:hypothetical protein